MLIKKCNKQKELSVLPDLHKHSPSCASSPTPAQNISPACANYKNWYTLKINLTTTEETCVKTSISGQWPCL